jgi:hypothetical protein
LKGNVAIGDALKRGFDDVFKNKAATWRPVRDAMNVDLATITSDADASAKLGQILAGFQSSGGAAFGEQFPIVKLLRLAVLIFDGQGLTLDKIRLIIEAVLELFPGQG